MIGKHSVNQATFLRGYSVEVPCAVLANQGDLEASEGQLDWGQLQVRGHELWCCSGLANSVTS